MPQIGDIKRVNRPNPDSHKLIWWPCIDCGKERWIEIIKGQPSPKQLRCRPCSRKGSRNGNWVGDRATENTGRQRAIRMYSSRQCIICGKPGERHHKDGNTLNNNPDNVVFLCRSHHMEADGRLATLISTNKNNPQKAKLDKRDVIKIRNLLKEGIYQKEIASRYGVSDSAINAINRSISWKGIGIEFSKE